MLLHKVIGSIVGEITSLTQLVEYWHTMREDPGSNTIMDNVFFRLHCECVGMMSCLAMITLHCECVGMMSCLAMITLHCECVGMMSCLAMITLMSKLLIFESSGKK
jgi:uncharacterized membrane protein